MMFCAQCGKPNPHEARFCFSCGESMAVVALAGSHNAIPVPSRLRADADVRRSSPEPEAAPSRVIARLLDWRFLGSTVALVVGWVFFASGFSSLAEGVNGAAANSDPGAGLVGGPIIIVGAMAYRSLKRSRLALRRKTTLRRVMELAALAIVLLIVFLQNDALNRMYNDPITNVLIPAWVIIAYALLASIALG